MEDPQSQEIQLWYEAVDLYSGKLWVGGDFVGSDIWRQIPLAQCVLLPIINQL